MEEKTLHILEFDKICEQLAEEAVLSLTKEKCLHIRPAAKMADVLRYLEETNEAVGLILRRSEPPIRSIRDIRPAFKRAEIEAVLSMQELRGIAHLLHIVRDLIRYVEEESLSSDAPHLGNLFSALSPMDDLERCISHAIVSDEEMADDASSTLLHIRRKSLQLQNKIKDVLLDMIHSSRYQSALQDALVTMRGDRYVIPVKAERKGQVAGIVHDSSSSGATLFVEPAAVVEINNEIRKLAAEEKEEIERILAELSAEVSTRLVGIRENFRLVRSLDFIFAKAKYALRIDGQIPEVNQDGIVNIKEGRHPLLDRRKVVPINIYIGEDFDTLVITGPNTGGKTVALKTLGLFTLMTQAGLLIPAAARSQISVFRHVFADIGDEQSIEQSLSTFSAHMVNIVRILQKADDHSLVLFDELGAGTDPTEGAALAVAILEYVKDLGAKTAATTHYSEIKMYALSTPRAVNAACEFDVTTLSPTYRLLIGVPGKSNAFAISRKLGLSENVIARAKTLMSSDETKMEDVIAALEQNRQKAENEAVIAARERQDAESFRAESAKERQKITEQKDKIIERARREAKDIVEETRREMDEMLKEAKKKLKAGSLAELDAAIGEYRRKTGKRKNELDDALTRDTLHQKRKGGISAKNIRLGDSVEVTTLGQVGSVLTLPDTSGNLQVQVGVLKVTTNLRDLAKVPETGGKEVAKRYVSERVQRVGTPMINGEIHVRGLTLEEARMEVDKFLDDAVMANLGTVRIVHGKGTGILREGIADLLRSNRHVEEFRLGRYGEGEDGVTIVTLK